ncbi:MAG: TlpA family protein disulfide reductase [Paludibacteraceae bacterium]|nr:TlpA family protein disulfide reductase [Paludibacteraceae bacterium]
MKPFVRPIALLCSLLPLLLAGCIDDPRPSGGDLGQGDRLPAFSVRLSDGTLATNESLHGAPALIVFFHTGCADCRQELPVIDSFYRTAGTGDPILGKRPSVQVVCISREEEEDEVAAYWQEQGLSMPYSAQADRKVYSLFASSRIPQLYMIDRYGVITALWDDRQMPSLQDLLAAIP